MKKSTVVMKIAMTITAISLTGLVSGAAAAPWICEKYYQCTDSKGTVLYPTALAVNAKKAVAQTKARSSAARIKATKSYGCVANIKASTDANGKTESCYIAPADRN